MSRVRISTTVDGEQLERCRRLLDISDSQLLDRALDALIDEREREALGRLPYDDDPDLAWSAPDGPDMPYDGEIPEDVRRLAEQRRQNPT